MHQHRLKLLVGAVLALLISTAPAGGQDKAPASDAGRAVSPAPTGDSAQVVDPDASLDARGGLVPVDWAVVVLYGLAVIGLGWYYSRKQQSTQEYFVGGRNMNPALIGISLFATLLSTISYLAYPGEAMGKGPALLVGVATFPIAYLIVGYLIIPVYMRHRVTSAYELLEARLGIGIRLLGSVMFILLRLVWMSMLVYMAAKAMTIMLGVDESLVPLIVLVTGVVSVIYTSLGGLRAVVITDLVQTILLFGGALLVILLVTIDFGGFGWFPDQWQENWDTQPLISFDPQTRLTIIGTFFMYLVWTVCTAGGDQTAIQRFMATGDAKAARRSYGTNLIVATVVLLTLTTVGFCLLGYFQAHPELVPADLDLKEDADKFFPRYIAYHLPAGLSGLVVAAMFAAAMSSIDSGINSITAVVMTDFLDRFGKRPRTEKGHVRSAQLLAFGIGAVVVFASTYMKYIEGNFTAMTKKTVELLVTPIFGLFFFALFVPFARPLGVLAGALCGTTTAILIAYSGDIFGRVPVPGRDPVDPISFQWIGPAALGVNLAIGTLVSLLLNRSAPRAPDRR